MGIEENLERIAVALETVAEVQSRLAAVAEWNKARLGGNVPLRDGASAAAEAAEPERRAAPDHAPEAGVRQPHQWTYEELKAELKKRGVEVAKGTKMTTLLKFWERHKNDPEMQALPAETSAAPAEQAAEASPEPAEQEAPAVELFDGQEEPAPVPEPAAKPMTELEARQHIMAKGYTGTPEQIALLKKALAAVGAAKFADVANLENGYDKLIAEFDRLTEEK